MPTPSYPQLRRKYDALVQRVTVLSEDPNYGITTRPAIPFAIEDLRKRGNTPRFVVFLDIDDCHGANAKYGYEAVNGKIKRAVKIRHVDVLLRARWFSGDELIFLLRGDPEGFTGRLRTAFFNVGLSATMAHTVYTGDLESDVRTCAAVVQAKKNGYPV